MKLFICGYARHGKDEVAGILKRCFGASHESSSHIAMKEFLREELATKYGLVYESEDDCYADRVNHRALWHKIISEYNRDDLTRLSRLIFSKHDIYVGIRCRRELWASLVAGVGDMAVWVDATKRVGTIEPDSSNTITTDDCLFTITNNESISELRFRVGRVFSRLLGVPKWKDAQRG
jgi:hypothetical protein